MPYDLDDTIVALASAPGGAARGIVRLSGPRAIECAAACWQSDDSGALSAITAPRRVAGSLQLSADATAPAASLPGALYVWPGERSYTRQPAVELHTCGSPPLLAAAVAEFCRHGARPAAPGEFTLRAFLAGRMDLVQAEAVLGVVDARSAADLERALDQLAGGLSRPLRELREQLLAVLAELEAGLDFAEEPIEFIGRAELRGRLAAGRAIVAAAIAQLAGRERPADVPRVALTGPANVGKSRLFNALVERYGAGGAHARSIVSPIAGATRDFVSAALELDGVACELLDVAGEHAGSAGNAIDAAAQHVARRQAATADLRLRCALAGAGADECHVEADEIRVAMKADLTPAVADPAAIACSGVTGAGIDALAAEIRRRLAERSGDRASAAATAARCLGSLREADRALAAAVELVPAGGDELLAAEIRAGLQAVGEVVGAVCADDVLDRVFSQFCIGK